jgi:hypothetical protein
VRCQRGNITNRDHPKAVHGVCVDDTRLLRTLAANLLPTRSLVHSFSSLLTTRPTSPTSSHATLIGTQSHSLAFILLCHRYPLRALPRLPADANVKWLQFQPCRHRQHVPWQPPAYQPCVRTLPHTEIGPSVITACFPSD